LLKETTGTFGITSQASNPLRQAAPYDYLMWFYLEVTLYWPWVGTDLISPPIIPSRCGSCLDTYRRTPLTIPMNSWPS